MSLRKGYEARTDMLSMDDLTQMNQSLRGLTNIKLADEGNFIFNMPTQILDAPEGSVAYNQYGKISRYVGMPELIMAEDFVGIKPTLEKEYLNYKLPAPSLRGIFEYDLNKNIYDNIRDFSDKIANNKEWFDSLEQEVKDLLYKGQLFGKVGDDMQLLPLDNICTSDYRRGSLIDHIAKYKTEIIFFAKPLVSVRLNESDQYGTNYLTRKVVKTEEEAELYGIDIGLAFDTPLKEAAKLYSSAFYFLYEKPLFDQFSQLPRKDVVKMSEYQKIQEKKLITAENYKVLTLLNRIPTNSKTEIELEPGKKIPSYYGTMYVSQGTFQKIGNHPITSDAYFEPSFALINAVIPKKEGNSKHHIGQQYRDMKFQPINITKADVEESNKNPFIAKDDKEYAKRLKETVLNFSMTESFVNDDSGRLGKELSLAEMNEIIRQVLQPLYHEMKKEDETNFTTQGLKSFLINDLKFSESQIEGLEVGLENAQFSGAGNINQPQEQPQEPIMAQSQVPLGNIPVGNIPTGGNNNNGNPF